MLDNADEKLEGLIHDALLTDLRTKLEQSFERAEMEDEDTSHLGQFTIQWLHQKFGVAQMEIISLVDMPYRIVDALEKQAKMAKSVHHRILK